ncbi:ARM repeat superfamily protein [Perilla frutescens var. hirtella]|uniref:ARM repeat superfamily protein n=1 Tax=Perilla frutescens var. hirtella TaxID=608512 RepID=A0AAD4P5L9_PERFH|nr:ARM repeat superfamily protein [Perilla frutescens var. hirtella]
MLYCCKFSALTRVSGDGGQAEIFSAKKQSSASDVERLSDSSSSSNDGYIGLFIRMLGLDNDPLDREQAVVALWKYSLGGKHCVDNIMKYPGTVNLIVNLLKSDSDSACEAAAGLLRVISSINLYRDLVAESGAVEEMTVLLAHSSLSSNVKEQALCTLWNLTVDEKLSAQITSSEILPLIVKYLEDEDIKVKEAAGGVLANLTLTQSNHKIMVEAGVIPKLAKLLTADVEESKVVRKVARNALLELAKDEYNRILIMEEDLVLVPLVGAAAYKSFRPALYSWPSLPDGTEIEQSSKGRSRYGASELLLGLSIDNKNADLEEAKMKAVVGRTQQQFLARIGAIENEDDSNPTGESSANHRFTLLPWMDAVARLVLILGLEDESAIAKAAESIADASINEHMRVSFKEAGAIKHLVQLINHPSDYVRLAAIRALDRLSISNNVCRIIEEEGVLHPLINLLKLSKSDISHTSTSMILNILTRILDPNKELKSKLYDGPVNGSKKEWHLTTPASANARDMISPQPVSSTRTIARGDLVDLVFLSRLVDILKTPIPDLQRKAASVLEFIMVIEPQPCMEKLQSTDIVSGLEAVFRQKSLIDEENGREPSVLELEEAGLAVAAASRLLTKLLDDEQFRQSLDSHHLTKLLRSILVSSIPLRNKDWVAASLVKLSSLSGGNLELEDRVNMEVTVYERIPRLIEEMKNSCSPEVEEAAVMELNRIIAEGTVESSRAVGSSGGIFALVKLMEKGSERAVEASLSILYNLSMEEENHAAIVAAGAVPLLRKLVLSERPQWMLALRLLRTLPTSY